MDCIPFKEWNFCPFCGADIRKPEEEKTLILKSGETVAINWRGKDYLCVMPFENCSLKDYELHFKNNWFDPTRYKLFSLIEKEGLTDEIAKLRPMVIEGCKGERPRILYGIDNGMGVFVDHARYRTRLHLATAKELQEAE